MQSQLDNSRYARSILSNSTRRDVLWNVSEPGDPYDIKKSMIAKLPGDKKVFMGQHLELVCLLQAAEIQRLCEFLDEYRLKFREIERNNLDRHSYEVQIKELTQKVNGQDTLRNENTKLKQFSKRLQGEIEFLQRNSRESSLQDETYKINYEKTLERLTLLTNQNQELRKQIEDYRYQIQTFNARFEALERAKNREIEDLKLNFSQFSKESYESSLNSIRIQSETELRRLQFQLKRLKETNDAKNIEITELQNKNRALIEELQRFGQRQQYNYNLQGQIREYENKFVIFGTEIQRLNIALRDYTNKLEQSERKRKQLDGKGERLQNINLQLQNRLRAKDMEIGHLNDIISKYENENRRVGESQQIISQYESKITIITRDYEALSTKLKYQVENSKRLKEEIEKLTFQNSKYRLIERENQNLKDGVAQITILKKKIAELQNRNMILTQQLERIQYGSKAKDAQIERYRSLTSQNESLKSKISQLQYSYNSRSEIQISRIKSEYEQKISSMSRIQGTELQSRIQVYQSQLEKLKSTLKLKNDESEKQRSKIYELQATVGRSDIESTTRLKNYEITITNLKRENEQFYNKLKLAGENERKIFQYQNKLSQCEREIERLGLNIKAREDEIINLRAKIREIEGFNQKYQFESSKTKTVYEQNFNNLRIENETLNKKLNELVNESNKKLKQALQEIQRLGVALRTRNEQKTQLQGKIKQLTQQNDYLKQNLQKLGSQNDELKKRLAQYELKINTLFNEGNSNIRTLSQENDQLKKQLTQLKNQINLYQFQVNKKITIYEQNTSNIGRQNDDLKRRITQYDERLQQAAKEIERLGQQLRTKNEEINALRTQYDKAKISFKQYETNVNNHMEQQVKKRFNDYQQKIQELLQENDQLKKRLAENSNKFNIQFERINATLKQISQENQNLKTQLKKQTNERRQQTSRFEIAYKQLTAENQTIIRQFKEYEISVNQRLEGDIQRKMIAYQESITKLSQQNDELRRKLQEVNTDLSRKLSDSEGKYIGLTQQYEKLRISANALAQQKEAFKKKGDQYQASIVNYEAQVKRRFQIVDQNIASLNKQNEELRRRLQELSELNRKLSEYESRMALLSQELQRVSNNYKTVTQQNENLKKQLNEKHAHSNNFELQVSRKVTTYESNLSFLQKQNEQLKKRLTDTQFKLKSANIQFQKLNNAYKLKGQQFSRLEVSIKTYENEVRKTFTANDQNLNVLARQNDDLKKRLAQYGDVNRKSQQLQNRLALLSQQFERLSLALKTKQQQSIKLDTLSRNQANQIDSWKKRYNELQTNFTNTYEFEIKKKFNNYEQTISEFNKRNTQTEGKLNNSIQQIQRLNNILRLKVDQSSQQTIQLKNLANQYEQFKRKVRENDNSYNQSSTALKRQNDQLKRRIQQYQAYINQSKLDYERKFNEMEGKLKMASQQIQRLNGLLKARNDQFQVTKRKFKQYQYSINQTFEGQVKSKFSQYQSHITNITKENEDLRRKLIQAGELSRKLVEYENKVVLLSQEMERLNVIINSKIDENQKINVQNEQLRRKLMEFSEINRRIPEYEQKMALILQQNQKLQYGLRNKTEDLSNLDLKFKQLAQQNDALKKNITTLEFNWNTKYESDIRGRAQAYEQTIANLNREKDDLNRKKNQLQSKIALLGQEMERLTALLKAKTDQNVKLLAELQNISKKNQQKIQSTQSEFVILQNNYNLIVKEYETSKRHLQQYEQSIRKLYTEFERLQGIINELKKENQTLHAMNHNLSNEINRLTQQNKDLDEQVTEVRLRLSDESALQKRISEHLALMVVLFAQIETLRNRVKDKEKEVAEVRRSSLAPNIL